MRDRIKIALCGAHAHAEKFGRMINSYSESETTAVWDEDSGRSQAIADVLNCRKVDSIDALMADPDITGVVISTLNDRHRELVIKAAQNGKHIFLEKPLADSLENAYAIRDAVKKSGVKFYMSDPFVNATTTYIRDFMRSGRLGRVLSIRIRFCSNIALLQTLPEKAVREKAMRMGGGMMSDTGGHPLHILNYLLGNPRRVYARFSYVNNERKSYGCEEYITMMMEYEDEITAVVECGTMAAGYTNHLEVCGTLGAIVETGLGDHGGGVQYRICQISQGDVSPSDLRQVVNRGEWVSVPKEELGPPPDDHIRYFVRMQAEDIPNEQVGIDPRSTHGTSIDTAVELMECREAIYRAVKSGRGEPLPQNK